MRTFDWIYNPQAPKEATMTFLVLGLVVAAGVVIWAAGAICGYFIWQGFQRWKDERRRKKIEGD
jgi:hypothetical protein